MSSVVFCCIFFACNRYLNVKLTKLIGPLWCGCLKYRAAENKRMDEKQAAAEWVQWITSDFDIIYCHWRCVSILWKYDCENWNSIVHFISMMIDSIEARQENWKKSRLNKRNALQKSESAWLNFLIHFHWDVMAENVVVNQQSNAFNFDVLCTHN